MHSLINNSKVSRLHFFPGHLLKTLCAPPDYSCPSPSCNHHSDIYSNNFLVFLIVLLSVYPALNNIV